MSTHAHAPTPAAATAEPHPPSTPTRSPSLGIMFGVGLAVLFVVLFFLAPSGDEKKQDDEPTSSSATSNPSSQRPSASPSQTSTLANTYEFANSLNEKVEVYLEFRGGEMLFIPLGGWVKVTPQAHPEKAYIMIPGEKIRREPLPDGWFIFEPANTSATGLMIVQNIRR